MNARQATGPAARSSPAWGLTIHVRPHQLIGPSVFVLAVFLSSERRV
jgi:hypothetical protein